MFVDLSGSNGPMASEQEHAGGKRNRWHISEFAPHVDHRLRRRHFGWDCNRVDTKATSSAIASTHGVTAEATYLHAVPSKRRHRVKKCKLLQSE
jgi:hypothetical protein